MIDEGVEAVALLTMPSFGGEKSEVIKWIVNTVILYVLVENSIMEIFS